MSATAGVARIVRFNWPWYAGALAVTFAALGALGSGALSPPLRALGVAALAAADLWLLASLAVSHYLYDRSPVARGAWLDLAGDGAIRRVGVFHAGHDEATAVAARRLPGAELRAFDVYDPERSSSPSLERARARAPARALPAPLRALPLANGALDLALVVFAAHEIRARTDRAAFFRELARALAPDGRALVVEHLRDGWNFLAYGPGAFHFLSRSTWLESFRDGGLAIQREARCTPFVRLFRLGCAP